MPVPRATYRVQLWSGFGFDQAAALADYLAGLGVSHLYSSPCLQAAPGSTHGYDVVDPSRVNDELGGEAAHERLCAALATHDLGVVLDVVPNHMWVGGPANRWWWDVLERGPGSPYADWFDISWEPPDDPSPARVLLPVLGQEPSDVLASGELKLVHEDGRWRLRYYDHAFPVAAGTLAAAGFDPEAAPERTLEAVNGAPGRLKEVLDRQFYRLAHWRVASHEVTYRRFFHITQLAGLRIEDPAVQEATHGLIYEWLRAGVIDGLRIDHPDGLRDPGLYFRRLREAVPDAWVVVEKILEPEEPLRESWPIAGTTGYDFGWRVGGLFVDPAGEKPLTRLYTEFTGQPTDWDAYVRDGKSGVLEGILAADVERLVDLFDALIQSMGRSEPRIWQRDAIREVVACFPVYRTYLDGRAPAHPEDARVIEHAVAQAKVRRRHLSEVLDLLREVLLMERRDPPAVELALRFQQLTGPAMAKGVEDTAFFRFLRFTALNEVGGAPSHFGVSIEAFHLLSARSQETWPEAMLGTSTHDSKRSEDVRARLHLLSEMPERWSAAVARWAAMNARHRQGESPSANDEYHLYQALVGAWPIANARVLAFMEKATREEKRETSWVDPSPEYDAALRTFVGDVLSDEAFRTDLEAFVSELVEPGRLNSLAQTLIKLTAPGVPDIYQGCELWDHSLTDPDNRRPVDYGLRRRLQAELAAGMEVAEILRRADEGLPKLFVIREALRLRAERPRAFGREGVYEALASAGTRGRHVVAFARGGEAITVVPRLVMTLGGPFAAWDWGDTAVQLPQGRWRNRFTGARVRGGMVPVGQILSGFPVALLAREEASS